MKVIFARNIKVLCFLEILQAAFVSLHCQSQKVYRQA